jgi:hypothetical protein
MKKRTHMERLEKRVGLSLGRECRSWNKIGAGWLVSIYAKEEMVPRLLGKFKGKKTTVIQN